MTDADRAHLQELQAAADAIGRKVAQVRISGGSYAEEEAAMAELDAAKRRMADFMGSLGTSKAATPR